MAKKPTGFYRGLRDPAMREDLCCPVCAGKTLAYAGLDFQTVYFACSACKAQYVTPRDSLRKGIIYLDQWALSLMHKSTEGREDLAAWRDILKRLSNLVCNQIVVCPNATYHQIDSDLKPDIADDLNDLFRHLAHDVSFQHPQTTEVNQLMRMLEAYDSKTAIEEIEFAYREALSRNTHSPSDDLFIHIPQRLSAEQIQETWHSRNSGLGNWEQILSEVTPDDLRNVEGLAAGYVLGFARDAFRNYVTFLVRRERMWADQEPFDIDYLHNTSASVQNNLIYATCCYFERKGADLESALRQTQKFLASEYFQEMPSLKIAGLLIAAVARKTLSGRKPKPGDMGDVNLIRTYLPYCDVMLVDNEFRAMATESPIKLHERYPCRLISSRTQDEFTDWLDEQEQAFVKTLARREEAGEIPDARLGASLEQAFLSAKRKAAASEESNESKTD